MLRALITDSGPDKTGWSVGVSFATGSTPQTLLATVTNSDAQDDLKELLSGNQKILDGWNFTPGVGYTAGQPAYLSFDVGVGQSRDDLQVWHLNAANVWENFASSDLTYDGRYASFTVTGFSGYVVTGVPEPGTLVMLAAAGLGLLGYVGRRRD